MYCRATKKRGVCSNRWQKTSGERRISDTESEKKFRALREPGRGGHGKNYIPQYRGGVRDKQRSTLTLFTTTIKRAKEQKTAVTHASQFRLMRLPYGRTTTKPSDDQAPMPNRTLLIYAFATGPSFPLHAQSTKQKPHRQETQRILKEKTCFCEAVPTSPRRRNLGESPRGDTRVVALFSSKRSKPERVQFNKSVVQSSIAPTFKLVSYVM